MCCVVIDAASVQIDAVCGGLNLTLMNFNTYFQNGIAVSEMGFGAWQLGLDSVRKEVTKAEAERMIHTALDYGINFFDSAPMVCKR